MLTRAVACGFALILAGANANAASVIVEINGVRSAKGTVRAALHNGAAGFPGKRAPAAAKIAKANSGTVSIKFEGVTPGNYAVAVFHDENGNRKLDTNLVGAPTEGYGFSRDARGAFGPPNFKSATFTVNQADMTVSIKMGY